MFAVVEKVSVSPSPFLVGHRGHLRKQTRMIGSLGHSPAVASDGLQHRAENNMCDAERPEQG